MKNLLVRLHQAALAYALWGWPVVLLDAGLDAWLGDPASLWRHVLNDAGFAYVLCAAAALITLVADKDRRERAMALLCGVREGDERERAVTGGSAKTTLLLSLALQLVLLVLSLTTVQLVWNPSVPKGEHHGTLSVGLKFSSADHLSAFRSASPEAKGYVLPPASFPILLILILLQVGAFKAFSRSRYEGADA
jgi:hypothetical protein